MTAQQKMLSVRGYLYEAIDISKQIDSINEFLKGTSNEKRICELVALRKEKENKFREILKQIEV